MNKIREKNGKSNIVKTVSVTVLAVSIALLMFYIFKGERSEYHVDVTDTLLWGAASAESGSLYNPDFWYAYMIPFSGTLIMIPLVKLFGVTYLTHMLGMAIFSLIFVIAVFLCLRALSVELYDCFLITGLFVSFLMASRVTRMIFFCHVIHYSLGILFTCTAIFLTEKVDRYKIPVDNKNTEIPKTSETAETPKTSDTAKKQNPIYYIYLLTLLVWIFCCCTNGVSSFMFFLIPYLAAYVIEKWIFYGNICFVNVKKYITQVILMFIAAVAGFAFKWLYIGNNEYESNFSSFLPSDEWMFKNNRFINQWVTLFTDDVNTDLPFLTKYGIFTMASVCMAFLALVLPVVFLAFQLKKKKEERNRLLILFNLDYIVVFLLTMYIYSISTVSNQNWRLCELYGMAVLTSLIFLTVIIREGRFKRTGLTLLGMFAICSCIYLYGIITDVSREPYANRHDRMVRLLEENDLDFGYSTLYDSANVVTVLSDSAIRVSPIEVSYDGTYKVYKYQSEASWYENDGECFVVLLEEEKEWLKDTLIPKAIREIEFEEGCSVYVFEKNIFKDLNPVY